MYAGPTSRKKEVTSFWCLLINMASLIKMAPFLLSTIFVPKNAKLKQKLCKLCFINRKDTFIPFARAKMGNI